MLDLNHENGAPGAIRTRDLWLRRPILYPAELQVQVAHSNEFKFKLHYNFLDDFQSPKLKVLGSIPAWYAIFCYDHNMSTELEAIKLRLQEFAKERDWDQFHSPKNFSMALVVECAELVEHFQWLTDEQSKHLTAETLDEVSLEMADIMIYLIRLADKLDINLLESVNRKIKLNAEKYPIEKSKGLATKYNKL